MKRSNVNALVFVGALLAGSMSGWSPASGQEVADSFDRVAGPDIGTTEIGKKKWVAVEVKGDDVVAIDGGGLSVNYNHGPSPTASVNLADYKAADVEIRVRARGHYDGADRWHGLSYRMESPTGNFQAIGYHAMISSGAVRLTFGTKELASKPGQFAAKSYHEIRVLAVGASHKVYVDGTLCLDVNDASKLDAGHVGLTEHYQAVVFDDFAAGKPGTLRPMSKPAPTATPAPRPTATPAPTATPKPVKAITIRYDDVRKAFIRGERADLRFRVLTPAGQGFGPAAMSVDVGGLVKRDLAIGKIAPGSSASAMMRVDTRLLKAGEYSVKCELKSGGTAAATLELPIWVARRWNPDRMRVWLWPHTRFHLHVKKLDAMARQQFAWYANIGVNSFQPGGELNAEQFEVFDYGLVNGWEMGVGLSGGLRAEGEGHQAYGLGPEAQYTARRDHKLWNPFHPEVARKQDDKNRELMEIVRQFPGVKTTFFNTEIIDAMGGLEPPGAREYHATHVPATVKHEFIKPGVIHDNDERYATHLFQYKWGDGLATANLRTATMAHRYDPDHLVFTDPCRAVAILDLFPGMGVVSTWTYTNPDPKYMLFIETLIAVAKPAGQGVMQTVTLLNYPGTIYPKDKGWPVMGPARMVETNWINLSRRPGGLSIYLSSACDPFDTLTGLPDYDRDTMTEPYQRFPPTFEAFKEFTETVVRPYGPMIGKLDRSPRRVAVLSSESSRTYSASPNLLGHYGNYQIYSFYTLLNMIHVAADVVLDETIARYGLDDYDVLVLPKCDTLTATVYEKILAFGRRGGLVISDQYLRAPIPDVIRFDFDFTHRNNVSANAIMENKDYARWDDQLDVDKVDMKKVKGVTAELDQKIMEGYAARLRKGLAGKVARTVDCSSPTALLNVLEKGPVKYLFVINDKRVPGDRVGQYKAMLDKAVPQTVTVTLNAWEAPSLYAYDVLEKKLLTTVEKGGVHVFDVDLPAPGGKIIALLPRKVGRVEIRAPKRIAERGGPIHVAVLIDDDAGNPLAGVQPIELTITDPKGVTSEFSDYHAAKAGSLTVDFVPAVNDLAGTWTIRARELISGLEKTVSMALE